MTPEGWLAPMRALQKCPGLLVRISETPVRR